MRDHEDEPAQPAQPPAGNEGGERQPGGESRTGGPGEPPPTVRRTMDRFDKFTERAKRALSLAEEEARGFNHNYIGTEHLLLGLVREQEGIAAKVLANLGVNPNKVREGVVFIIGRGNEPPTGEPRLTPRARRVIELAVEEARRLSHNHIGTEHLLLGLVREGEGVAAGVLVSQGINLEDVRAQVLTVVQPAATPPPGGRSPVFRLRDAVSRSLVRSGPSPSGATRDNVVTCRVEDGDLEAIDMLVEAGIRTTRSDAASWLIRAGIETNRPLFERVRAAVTEIRRLREEAQAIAEHLAAGGDAGPLPGEPPAGPA